MRNNRLKLMKSIAPIFEGGFVQSIAPAIRGALKRRRLRRFAGRRALFRIFGRTAL
jgi:hypothetical protein